MNVRALLVSLALVCVLAGCDRSQSGAAATSSAAPTEKTLQIAVIPKGTTHEFWKAVHAGAVKASRETGAKVLWKGPLKEDDLKSQIDIVQRFTARGVSGIVLAPLNDKALVSSVKGAVRAKIPVVVFDSALQGKHHVSFVATDNVVAGKLAGKRMAKLLDNKGNVLVLRYQEGSASTSNREKGFLAAIGEHKDIKVVSSNRYGGATTESAAKAAESLLLAHKAAAGGVNGIFCPNESTTFGMLRALQNLGLAGKIKFVGFDSSEKLVKALTNKQIDALVLQDPFNMGYLAVKTMVQHLQKDAVDPTIDTGSQLVDLLNMDEPRMQDLLKPDLKTWLGE